MPQPAQIAVKEGAQVVHAVFQHREPIDPGAEGEALHKAGNHSESVKALGEALQLLEASE